MIVKRALAAAKAGSDFGERIAEDLATVLGNCRSDGERRAVLARLDTKISTGLTHGGNVAVFQVLAQYVAHALHDRQNWQRC